MEKTPLPKRPLHQRIARGLIKVILGLLLLIVVLFLLLLTPPVQRFATSKVESYLTKTLQTKVEIGSISIGLPRKVLLKNIYIEDRQKDTLLYGSELKVDIELLKLMSGEVSVHDVQLTGITAKIKRLLPDMAFNFQFVVDAFMTGQKAKTDTAATAPLKLRVDRVGLKACRIIYNDVVTGNDMTAGIEDLVVRIDSLNLEKPHYAIGNIGGTGLRVKLVQRTPLVTAKPLATDLAEAAAPPPFGLSFGNVDLRNIQVDYDNDASATAALFSTDRLQLEGRQLDLTAQKLYFGKLALDGALTQIKLRKSPASKAVAEGVKQEATAQAAQPWDIRFGEIFLNGAKLKFDNDNTAPIPSGIDFAHMLADSLTLHAKDVVFNPDSIALTVTRGELREKSGFRLEQLEGDLLYTKNQAYLKNLVLRTPGTLIRRSAILEYASQEALVKNAAATVLDLEITDSRVQVRDILYFAPQLRSNPAMRNPSDVWKLNLIASGTMERLFVEALQFEGLGNTRIDASGTLSAVTNPNAVGGVFRIRNFHTTQTDLKLLTGQKQLLPPNIWLPEAFDLSGTLAGNMAKITTDLQLRTAAGNASVRGSFANLTTPATASYNATIGASGLQLGRIMRNPQLGALTGSVKLVGRGLTPEAINTTFNGRLSSVGYNRYNYRNIALKGSLRGTALQLQTDIRDPNIDLNLDINGTLGTVPSFRVTGFVDSIHAQPLGFTATPFTFRGRIDADVRSFTPEALNASVTVTDALIVSGGQRVQLDSLTFDASGAGGMQNLSLNSDIAKLDVKGTYRLADLGAIIQNSIDPYFDIVPGSTIQRVAPYDFTFKLYLEPSPALTAIVPGLDLRAPVSGEGSASTAGGLNADFTAPSMVFGTNDITGLNASVRTTPQGLQINGRLDQLISGATHIYNTELRATALNNTIDFGAAVKDKEGKAKYTLAGIFRQPTTGAYALSLNPDSLLLNYDTWTVSAGNEILYSPTAIRANNFVLSRGGQSLSLQSEGGMSGGPLTVGFKDFRIGTLTNFLQQDSVLVDGTITGGATFPSLPKQLLFTSDINVSNLSFRQDTLGNLALKVSSNTPNRYVVDTRLTGFGNDLALTGSLAPQGDAVAMDLDLDIEALQLSTLEGALATVVKSARGAINGEVKINGTSTSPKVAGFVGFDSATITTTLIGGPLTINDERLTVSKEGFGFDNFTIRDSAGNDLNIDGSVATTNFVNYGFDLGIKGRNFRAVSTTRKDNKLFYGDMFLDVDLQVSGTEKAPAMDGSVVVLDKTDFTIVIPQAEPGVTQREGVVEFVDFDAPLNDSLFLTAYDSLNTSAITGIDIAANISIRREAKFNVLVDVASGDLLNLRGTGELTTGIDPSGKISLTGTYEIEEGGYSFSFNFLKRQFGIQKGSKITWYGEPTAAELDVTAVYVANTAPLDLVQNVLPDNASSNRNFYLQKLPFQVLLTLRGELMKPNLLFDIQLPEDRNYNVSSEVTGNVQTRLQQLRQEPSELNKQMFAVLLLNRFVGDNPLQSASGGGFNAGAIARQSVSKLLTEQLNNLAAGLIDGVDINFDVASSDDYTTGDRRSRTDLNVGLSKRLLNDRLTVSVGSNFMLEGPQQSNSGSNNIAGNVAVNYQLSKDGRYLVRFHRRNEYEGQVDGYVIETGLSFIMTVDYNRFRQIFQNQRIQREERQRRREEERKAAETNKEATKTEEPLP